MLQLNIHTFIHLKRIQKALNKPSTPFILNCNMCCPSCFLFYDCTSCFKHCIAIFSPIHGFMGPVNKCWLGTIQNPVASENCVKHNVLKSVCRGKIGHDCKGTNLRNRAHLVWGFLQFKCKKSILICYCPQT